MHAMKRVVYALRSLVRHGDVEAQLDDEMRFHLERQVEKYVALGVPIDEARRQARLDFGSVDAAKESHRDGRGARWLEDGIADVRYATRRLRQTPGFAAAAIVTLGLGIGANSAIFSAVNAVMLRPLPFAKPDRLVMLWESNPERGWVNETAAPANMFDWKEQVRAFEDIGAYASFSQTPTLSDVGEPRQLTSIEVTGNLFRVLGVRPVAGESFRDEETWNTGELTVMLTHRLWSETFGSNPEIVGHTIMLNSRPVRVVGVLPRNFAIPGVSADIFRPLAWDQARRAQVSFRRAHWLRPVARVRPGVTLEQANAELQTVVARLQRDYPATNTNMGAGFTPLHAFLVGESRRPLMVLLGAVGALLLIACANVGNLLLVQASGRWREASLRLALGAKRSRLVRQALTESLVLSVLGGAAGLILGWWSTKILATLRPAGILPTGDVAISWTVVAYVASITTLSGLLFGLAPALWSRGRAPAEAMRESGRAASGAPRARRWGEALLVMEVALALLLTTGAGLLIRSFWKLQQVDPGVDTSNVVTAQITLPGIRYDSARKIVDFWAGLERRLATLPGATSAATATQLPLTGPAWSSDFAVRGWPVDRFGVQVIHREVSPGYLATLRVPLLRGRFFDDSDRSNSNAVVVINDIIAIRYFKQEDPVGQVIAFDRRPDSSSYWYTIVGVIGSERQTGLAVAPAGEILAPIAQRTRTAMTILVRTTAQPLAIVPAVRRTVASLDPALAVAQIRTMDQVRAESASRLRFLMILLLSFAVVGLMLAVVGVYGVMAHIARGRTREMGIRIALGAPTPAVQWLVVRRGLALSATGAVAGLAAATLLTRGLGALLYDVQPLDPLTFALVPALLVAAGILATWLPAARASRTDPATTLRSE
jgi:predicted permease